MNILLKTGFLLLYIVTISTAIQYDCGNSNTSCGCGRFNIEMTSTENGNGQNAIEHSWPMIVVLDYSYFVLNPPSCTGSILNNYFILTAAHCVKDIFPFFIQIKAGIHSPVDVNAITRRVESIYLHPNYTGHIDGYANNIALLELDEPLNFNINLNIATTCIPSINTSINVAQYPKSGTRLAVIGWKSAKQGIMNIFTTLQQGEIFVIDNNDPMCLRSWINPEKQFCAGLSKDGGGEFDEILFLIYHLFLFV
jgi:hypothetical protein